MRSRWFTTRVVFLLLSIAVCSANAAPIPSSAVLPESTVSLWFDQAFALSDFDADGLMDEATLATWGAHRSVKVALSRSGKSLFLHFDNARPGRGSLFTQDLDNDGATDLIWTDLLHADGVVIWLGNGEGQFSRVSATAYAYGYTLPEKTINPPDESTRETSISAANNRSLDKATPEKGDDFPRSELPRQEHRNVASLLPTLGEPTDRAPPLPLF